MLTIFTVPKPFRGHVGDIQRNAIQSWRALGPDVQVILVGDEEGVEEAARDAGVDHVSGLARNDRGTPRLDSAFDCAARVARWRLWCFVNADIVLLDDFPRAIERVASTFSNFLIVGESRDLAVLGDARMRDAANRAQLRKRALESGRLRGYAALDYFVFTEGLFDPVPPFLIGRACFDNWFVWRGRELGRPVVDVTRSIVAVHQSHDYSHVAGGLEEAYYGEEARYNELLAGGREHIYSLHEVSHRLYRLGPPVMYWGSTGRAREKARRARIRVDSWIATHRARKTPLRRDQPVRVLGVFPEQSMETTLLLDALALDDDVDLQVVYAENAPYADADSIEPRHRHWFARTVRVAKLDRVLGRGYPITPTIWHSLYFVKPDCMLIAGWSTFPTQAAIAWCMVRRVPYLLLVDEYGRSISANGDGGFRRAIVDTVARRSAGVLVTGPASPTSMLARGVRSERVQDLPKATDATRAHLPDLARTACNDLRVRRRARRLRSRSVLPRRRR